MVTSNHSYAGLQFKKKKKQVGQKEIQNVQSEVKKRTLGNLERVLSGKDLTQLSFQPVKCPEPKNKQNKQIEIP